MEAARQGDGLAVHVVADQSVDGVGVQPGRHQIRHGLARFAVRGQLPAVALAHFAPKLQRNLQSTHAQSSIPHYKLPENGKPEALGPEANR